MPSRRPDNVFGTCISCFKSPIWLFTETNIYYKHLCNSCAFKALTAWQDSHNGSVVGLSREFVLQFLNINQEKDNFPKTPVEEEF